MRIVHFSDWHGRFSELPEADLYVCTGDMYPNFPVKQGWDIGYSIDPRIERRRQRQWASGTYIDTLGWDPAAPPPRHDHSEQQPPLRSLLGSPDAPIVCVKGNHDFIELAPLFEGCNLVQEFNQNEVVEVDGVTISGHRGIPYIYGGWDDEIQRAELLERVRSMPVTDLVLTHYAPLGILDFKFGLEGMASHFTQWPRVLHLFGHIHEHGGQTIIHEGYAFSNAACTINVLEYDKRDGTVEHIERIL